MSQTRGRFITLEGSEGVGKSSNLRAAAKAIEELGHRVLVTREPGGTPLAEQLRELLLAERAEPMHANAEVLLVFAARAQHVETVIKPALEAGKWVLSDRFTDASYAYQGGGRGVAKEVLGQLEAFVQGELRPDLTLYLDLDPDVGRQRIGDRVQDRIEQEQQDFFLRVRQAYLERAIAEPERFVTIDASQPLLEVQQRVREAVATFAVGERHE